MLPSQLITPLKLHTSPFCWEDVNVSFTLLLTCYCSLRDGFLHSLNCAERGLCPVYSLPQVELQPLCGCPHQGQLGTGSISLLPTVSAEHPLPKWFLLILNQ